METGLRPQYDGRIINEINSKKSYETKVETANISSLAGKLAPQNILVNIPKLISAYYTDLPDPTNPRQQISFGTSGHRGSSFNKSFNEQHVLAISQAICDYRKENQISGPLFIGFDTHALSFPANVSVIEVLAANGVEIMLAENDDYTPTPVISHAILVFNRSRTSQLADGIIITPSHNPPDDGGIKYNPPHGGPAEGSITTWIQNRANDYLKNELKGVKRTPYEKALNANTTHRHNYVNQYVSDLINCINMDLIRDSKIRIGVDPLGGAGISYWPMIAEKYGINLTVINNIVDPTFRFMTVDWDGRIRMDPSSTYAMQSIIGMKDKFDIAFACDTDHDRHGIVSRSTGLMPPNHYLSVAINYLFQNRPLWRQDAMIGKTIVSSGLIDRVASSLNRKICEVPVGFKWFVDGLHNGTLGFGGEESAGASFLRIDGSAWTTDKDGFIPSLLSAEIMAQTKADPGDIYSGLTATLGKPFYDRIDRPATPEQKKILSALTPTTIKTKELAGEPITQVLDRAEGNGASIGGIKVIAKSGWFAVRPSGTEDIYKIYAESFKSSDHLQSILKDAQVIVNH